MSPRSYQLIGTLSFAIGASCLTLGACHAPPSAGLAAVSPDTRGISEKEVIRRVEARQRKDGRDPTREKISASRDGDGWEVTSWHLFTAGQTGGREGFVPGGFTTYKVSSAGEITAVMPGL
jgi:hypothetical protein